MEVRLNTDQANKKVLPGLYHPNKIMHRQKNLHHHFLNFASSGKIAYFTKSEWTLKFDQIQEKEELKDFISSSSSESELLEEIKE